MGTPLAYVSGRLVMQDQAALPIHDAGVVTGATVVDFCRTFRQQLFRWSLHLARFRRDCEVCHVPLVVSDEELTHIARDLVAHNAALALGQELALITLATPGSLGSYLGQPGENGPPTLVLHTFPLALDRYRRFFTEGVVLVGVGPHHADPDDLAPPRVKHRSRLHWWRADQLLRRTPGTPPGAIPLLLDPQGCVTETAIGNLLIVERGRVLTPPTGTVLEGITLRLVREACARLSIEVVEQKLSRERARACDEAMLCGTAFGIAGVSRLEGTALPWPGPITRRLIEEFSAEAGLDVPAQFRGDG